jgi:cold shock CspA family protein
MRTVNRIVVGVLSGLLLALPPAFAADKGSGTVIAVDEEADVFTIKGSDGKTYQVEAASVVAEDLKTGDMVEYDIVEAKPVKVQKKAK